LNFKVVLKNFEVGQNELVKSPIPLAITVLLDI